MENMENVYSFETLITKIFHEEVLMFRNHLSTLKKPTSKRYITMKEVVSSTGISSSVLRQLTYSRAMQHLKIKGRIGFDENAIKDTVSEYKEFGWSDPEDKWTVAKVQSEILDFDTNKEDPEMIEDILREIIREELDKFSKDLYAEAQNKKTRYYGRTVLTVKEASEYFRLSPATIYHLIKEEGIPHFKFKVDHLSFWKRRKPFYGGRQQSLTPKKGIFIGNVYFKILIGKKRSEMQPILEL